VSAEQSLRVPVINDVDYTVYLQSVNLNDRPLVFVHADVRNWNPVIAKRLLSDWKVFVDLFNGPLFALNEQDDEKHRKFLALFGFEFLSECVGTDNVTRNLFVYKPQKE
jgi:hypothetical protein